MTKLEPCTVVPENLYVERSADRQIRQIIDGMGRPGYVLVARQMGKTNLLLHTRKLMETSSVIFTFIDFSIIGGLTETECFNYMIDETINLHYEVLSEAEAEIDQIRCKPNYTGYKMFTRELRVILKYVDKLVFVLDEIDALARTDYSDRVFSMIRSHYFQRDNYKELNKLTYILSGVIEPKDIIKDPNISPFNIGEKIYMNDFTREEFESFLGKVDIGSLKDPKIKNRLYYWTKGNPRLTWDVCSLVERNAIVSEADLDNVVKKYYLTAFDKAPIDAIRQKVLEEDALKEALIQLYFNKGELLSAEIKNQLYLAGIIDYDNSIPRIKNPILDKCLSYDWLMSIESKKRDYLTEADHAVWIDRDYKKAITYLNHFIEEEHSNEEMDRAHYLLGEAHFRSQNIEYAEKSIRPIIDRGKVSKYYYPSILILAYAYTNLRELDKALECYHLIVDSNKEQDELYLKAQIGKVGIFVEMGDEKQKIEAESILYNIIETQLSDTCSINILSLCQYYLAWLEEQRGDINNAIASIDSAINVAQKNEKQVLLYKKYSLVADADKELIADALYQSLSEVESKPSPTDVDNPLAFTQLVACQVLATLILEHPKYDVNKYLRLFLFDSKENAVIYIDTVLHQVEDSLASPFFEYIKTLLYNEDWNFEDEKVAHIALLCWTRNNDKSLAIDYVSHLFMEPVHDVSIKGVEILIRLSGDALNNGRLDDVIKFYRYFDENITEFRGITQGQRLLFDYYYACWLFQRDRGQFPQYGAELLGRVKEYNSSYFSIKGDRLKQEDVLRIIDNLQKKISQAISLKRQLGLDSSKETLSWLGRNSVVQVQYLTERMPRQGKLKSFKDDIEEGLCEIVSVVKK